MTSPATRFTDSAITGTPVPVVVAFKALAASQQIYAGKGYILDISGLEASGTAASSFAIHDGQDASGQIVAFIGQTTSAQFEVSPAEPGIPFRNGLYAERLAGTLSFVVTLTPVLESL